MGQTNPATILVVDDDVELLNAYRLVLQEEGHRVLTAHSGTEALALARREPPDLLVSDIVMPMMDGFELIERLREELGDSAPPAIVCSGFEITEKEALRRGARVFLAKPMDADTLLRAVESLHRHAPVDPLSISQHRRKALEQRGKVRTTSETELLGLDREETVRNVQPWLEWLRVYYQSAGAGVLLLQEAGLRPLVIAGGFPSNGPAEAFLRTNVTAVVETRTSLVIGDVRRHPSFRQSAPRADIAFFAGVPLLSSGDVAVGALCISDSSPRRFDAESLVSIEHLGRRAVSSLVAHRHGPRDQNELPRSPLLNRISFELLLTNELQIASRNGRALELAVLRLSEGTSAHACAVQLWRVGAGPRTAIGELGPEQIGLFKAGPDRDVARMLSVCLESVRSQGMLQAAGVASVSHVNGLTEEPLMRLAEGALLAANSQGTGGRIQRIVVRPEA